MLYIDIYLVIPRNNHEYVFYKVDITWFDDRIESYSKEIFIFTKKENLHLL